MVALLAPALQLPLPSLSAPGTLDFPEESWLEKPLTWIGRGVDEAIVVVMKLIVERALVPGPEEVARVRRSAAPYLDGSLDDEPARFFDGCAQGPTPPISTEFYLGPLAGGVRVERRIETGHGGPGDALAVEQWVHVPRRGRATIIALHGFAMGNPRFDAIALLASTWFRNDLDVALVTLPFHGARTPPGSRFSGDRFATPDVASVNEAVRQAVGEIRVLVRLLRHESTAPVGILGLSLGGYLAALLAGLDDDLDFVVSIVPPVCFGDLAWRFFAAGSHHESQVPSLSYEELRTAFRVHSPLTHALRTPRERVLIVAGRGDRIVPPEHPYTLWQHWGEPAIHWFSGSHLAPFGRRGIADAVLDRLRQLDIL